MLVCDWGMCNSGKVTVLSGWKVGEIEPICDLVWCNCNTVSLDAYWVDGPMLDTSNKIDHHEMCNAIDMVVQNCDYRIQLL